MIIRSLLFCLFMLNPLLDFAQGSALVFQSDFGTKDGAVAAMKGVAYGVSNTLNMFDITHEIPAYNIWEAAYRLNQTASYWPVGTVFVSVIDPGVGSERRSVVLKSKSGHFFVTPDNGTLTLIAETLGIAEVRLIDEKQNRLANSDQSYTFHGRDVYAYTAARLASGIIKFEEVGPVFKSDIIRIPYYKPKVENGVARGNIDILDIQYGNVWTNIDQKTLDALNLKPGDLVDVTIYHEDQIQYQNKMLFGKTFSDVKPGESIAYLNSLLLFSIGINQQNFAVTNNVGSGPGWLIEISRK